MSKRILSKYDGKKQKWLHDIIEIIIIFLVVLILFNFIIGVSFVKGKSMYPTLHNNEIAFYTRIIPIRWTSGKESYMLTTRRWMSPM